MIEIEGAWAWNRSSSDKEASWCVRGQRTTPQGPRSRLIHFITKTDENHCTGAQGDEAMHQALMPMDLKCYKWLLNTHQFHFILAGLMNKEQGSCHHMFRLGAVSAQGISSVAFLLEIEPQGKGGKVSWHSYHRKTSCCFVTWNDNCNTDCFEWGPAVLREKGMSDCKVWQFPQSRFTTSIIFKKVLKERLRYDVSVSTYSMHMCAVIVHA